MTDIFISYAHEDKVWIKKFARLLENEGYSVWWDRDILAGQDYGNIIDQTLDEAKCVICVWSDTSVQSFWVKAESVKALNRGVLVPVLIKDVELPIPFNGIHTEDLIDWKVKKDKTFQQILRSINHHVELTNDIPEVAPQKTTKRYLLLWATLILSFIALLTLFLNKKEPENSMHADTPSRPMSSNFSDCPKNSDNLECILRRKNE